MIKEIFALTINKSQVESLNNVGIRYYLFMDICMLQYHVLQIKKNIEKMIKPIIFNKIAGFYTNK
jgi:hypothetical protein